MSPGLHTEMKVGVHGDGVVFPMMDMISQSEDGEKGEGWFWLLQPKRGNRGAAEIGRPVPLRGHERPCGS